jgi:hypothetical protein
VSCFDLTLRCFLAARSFSHGCELAIRAVQSLNVPVKTTSAGKGAEAFSATQAGAQGGLGYAFDEQGLGCPAGPVVSALVSMIAAGEPHVILAINCLIFLTASKEASFIVLHVQQLC